MRVQKMTSAEDDEQKMMNAEDDEDDECVPRRCVQTIESCAI